MKKYIKYLLPILLVALIISFIAIYNIAFATEESLDEINISEENTKTVGAINWEEEKSYTKDYKQTTKPYTTGLPNLVLSNANVFCLYHGGAYPTGKYLTCEKVDLHNIRTKYMSGYTLPNYIIPYITTFSSGEYKAHRDEAAQWAIWAYTDGETVFSDTDGTNQAEGKKLYYAARDVDRYISNKNNKDISFVEDNNTGTILESKDFYKVGPFETNNYAFAYSDYVKNYSGKDVANGGIIGGIVGANVVLEKDDGTDKQIIRFSNIYSNNNDTGITIQYVGNNTSYTGIYPGPNTKFYILVNKSKYEGYTNLTLNLRYRTTEVSGDGWYITTNAQPLLVQNKSNVVLKAHTISKSVRLTTDVGINKYIYDVEHIDSDIVTQTGLDTTISAGNGRKSVNETNKQSNPVYVEYGDIVTYRIELKNNQNCDVKVRVRDDLPEGTEKLISVTNLNLNRKTDLTISNTAFITYHEEWVEIKANSTTTLEVKVLVNSLSGKFENRAILVTNNAGRVGDKAYYRDTIKTRDGKSVVNINSSDKTYYGSDTILPPISSDWYELNDYNVSIYKYINQYNEIETINNNNLGITTELNELSQRNRYTEEEKKNYPLAVEQNDTLIYSIILRNNSSVETKNVSGANKNATQIKPTQIKEIIQNGLRIKENEVFAEVYNENGTINTKYGNQGKINVTTNRILQAGNELEDKSEYIFTTSEKNVVLNPGDYIVYSVPVTVTESNMYLGSLKNVAQIMSLTNINHNKNIEQFNEKLSERVSIKADNRTNQTNETMKSLFGVSRIVKGGTIEVDRNIGQEESTEFVRMKDLVISGYVWLDKTKDGQQKSMENIVVRLYQIDPNDSNNPKLFRTVKTNSDGLYSFGFSENSNSEWRDGTYSIVSEAAGLKAIDSEQRIPKATNKDSNTQKYNESSRLYNYYVEFEYDGLVYKSTENYSYKNNLNNDGSIKQEYKTDSNATEFKTARNEFNSNYEIIGYNKAYNGNMERVTSLDYEKDGHNSYLKIDSDRAMTARSFITDTNATDKLGATDTLWLYKQNGVANEPYTDYLKYINLGLEERENADINVVQDVYEVRNIVNGEEITYCYNQNEYAKDGSSIDHDTSSTAAFTTEQYMTGFENNNSSLTPYEFQYYLADYYYKYTDYDVKSVRDYKTSDSELNTEITFRIKVKNNSVTNGDKVYAGINEVIEYFDNEFMNIDYNEDGTIKTINVKTKDEDGYLVDTPLKIADAYFALPNGSTIPAEIGKYNTSNEQLILSNSSIYNSNRIIDGYNTVYIRPNTDGVNKVILAEGENVDILIKFIVDKETDTRNIKLGLKTAIAEIGAYSTYYDDAGTKPAGLVDKDSNPGNFGETYNEISFDSNNDSMENDPYLAFYEDDTFKTGINIINPDTDSNERIITGMVWDDARTTTAEDENGIQYIGDGVYDNTKTKQEKAKLNTVLTNSDGSYKEETDFPIEDIEVGLYEIVRIPGEDNTERIYEARRYSQEDTTIKTNNDGKYKLQGYIPGEYIVKFEYGTDSKVSEMDAIFNGQDYKSTTYQVGTTKYADEAYLEDDSGEITRDRIGNAKKDYDEVLKILETANISDAKDDEIRRLETISYSETLNNNKTLILRGKNSTNKALMAEKTSMNAETTDFLVRAEKVPMDTAVIKYKSNRTYSIENIDFGLQYRPEQQVALNKFVKNLTVTTSDKSAGIKEALVDAKFNEFYGIVIQTDISTGATEFLEYENDNNEYEIVKVPKDANTTAIENIIKQYDGKLIWKGDTNKNFNDIKNGIPKNQDGAYQVVIAGTELDYENSIGLSNLQFVPSEYDRNPLTGALFAYGKDSSDNKEFIKSTQGFVYLNIDDEIMQGAEIRIEYLFSAHNISEIDRVNENLSKLRLKDNDEVKAYESKAENEDGIYSGALTARNYLYEQYYDKEIQEDGKEVEYRIKHFTIGEGKNDYYGSYLGLAYYTGKVGNDIVSAVKTNKILDYIDNNLVFKQEDNGVDSIDHFWRTTWASELVSKGYIDSNILTFESEADKNDLTKGLLLDSKGVSYTTDSRNNLALLQDVRTKDEQNSIPNSDITKYLVPRISKAQDSYGTVKIVVSKVISAEDDTANMSYENLGEIIEYSSVTGRITNINTTLGNVKTSGKKGEYYEARKESDTGAVERITLTPPTGRTRAKVIRGEIVKVAGGFGIFVVIALIGVAGTLGGIKLYRNRRIK